MLISEYLNYVNESGEPLGHGKKVLNEVIELVQNKYTVSCAASEAYKPNEFRGRYKKLNSIPNRIGSTELNKRIFANIRETLRDTDENVLWFTNVEWRLLAYLGIKPVRKSIVITVYRDILSDIENGKSKLKRMKALLIKKGLKKVKLVIVTNPNLRIHDNQIYLPDYYYGEKYAALRNIEKKERILCVGSMRKSKDLRGVVKNFNDTDIPVWIVGNFEDKAELAHLKASAGKNFHIEDRVLEYDEYYRMIAESRFTIMPYDMNFYKDATSGILLETMFLNSIPIAPQRLLTYNSVDGIGYMNISDLPKKYDELLKRGKKVLNFSEKYRKDIIFEELNEKLQNL